MVKQQLISVGKHGALVTEDDLASVKSATTQLSVSLSYLYVLYDIFRFL